MDTKVKSTKSIELLEKYTKQDIAIGVLIGFQCVLALTVIIYHLV